MNADVLKLWPELEWIEDADLREATARTWEMALERSDLDAVDLERIPFTLLVPDLKVSFMAHKRCVVHVARESALKMNEFFGDDLQCDLDTVIAGAILADVGKLLEYEKNPTAPPARATAASTCAIPSAASAWPWRRACPSGFPTSSPPTPARATWSSARPKPTSSTTPTS